MRWKYINKSCRALMHNYFKGKTAAWGGPKDGRGTLSRVHSSANCNVLLKVFMPCHFYIVVTCTGKSRKADCWRSQDGWTTEQRDGLYWSYISPINLYPLLSDFRNFQLLPSRVTRLTLLLRFPSQKLQNESQLFTLNILLPLRQSDQ